MDAYILTQDVKRCRKMLNASQQTIGLQPIRQASSEKCYDYIHESVLFLLVQLVQE